MMNPCKSILQRRQWRLLPIELESFNKPASKEIELDESSSRQHSASEKDKCMEIVSELINAKIATLPDQPCKICILSSELCKCCFREWSQQWQAGWKVSMTPGSNGVSQHLVNRMEALTARLLRQLDSSKATDGPCVYCQLVEGPCRLCMERFLLKLKSDRLTSADTSRILFEQAKVIPLESTAEIVLVDPRKKL